MLLEQLGDQGRERKKEEGEGEEEKEEEEEKLTKSYNSYKNKPSMVVHT